MTKTDAEREAWRRHVEATKAARAGTAHMLRVAIPIEEELPTPIVDALARIDEAADQQQKDAAMKDGTDV